MTHALTWSYGCNEWHIPVFCLCSEWITPALIWLMVPDDRDQIHCTLVDSSILQVACEDPKNHYLLVVIKSHGSWSIHYQPSLHHYFSCCRIHLYCCWYHPQVICHWLQHAHINQHPWMHHCYWINQFNCWYNLTN